MRLWDDEIDGLSAQIQAEAAAMVAGFGGGRTEGGRSEGGGAVFGPGPGPGADTDPGGDSAPAAPLTLEVVRAQRAAIAAMRVTSGEAVDRTIPGPAGPMRVRTFVPDVVEGVLLHIHGGGFILGDPEMGDQLNTMLSTSRHLAVVSLDYRLAPEHPFPAGPDDCEAAALWLIDHARAELGSDRLLIGGESAGAHLAALTLLRLRDRHQAVDQFRGANLVFGVYDLSRTPSQRGVGAGPDILSAPSLQAMAATFTPGLTDDDRRHPAISPLFADLRGLPPALFTVGTADHLLDDTLFMAARWQAAGNEAELLVYPHGQHGLTGLPTVAAHWQPRLLAFLDRCLRP